MKKPTLVKSSKRIKELLIERFTELKLSSTKVVADANERGMNFTIAMLSKYLNHASPDGGLSDDGILWLCFRYGINVHLLVGTPVIKNGKIHLEVESYDESKCIRKLRSHFPNCKE